jgi:very-short-patch-repair endonuclease
MPEEVRARLSEAIKRRWQDPDYARRVAEGHRGQKWSGERRRAFSEKIRGPGHPMYGKRHSEETRCKISEARRGRKFGLRSEETRRKISEALKRFCAEHGRSEEWRKKQSEARKGKKLPEETRRKISVKSKANAKLFWSDPTRRLYLSELMRGRVFSEETRYKISVARKRWWSNPENKRTQLMKLRRGIRRIMSQKTSSLEVAVRRVLDALDVEHIHQHIIGTYLVDFYLPKYNLVLECNGNYWHDFPDRIEHDKRREAYITSLGYKVVYLTEPEIRADVVGAVLKVLAEVEAEVVSRQG